jgi:hypothetical protein
MNIFYLKNIFYEHSKNEKVNYLQTVKVDFSKVHKGNPDMYLVFAYLIS